MIVRQMDLASGDSRMTVWLEDRATPGDFVTLKNSDDPLRRWRVLDTFGACELSSINRGWNNNI